MNGMRITRGPALLVGGLAMAGALAGCATGTASSTSAAASVAQVAAELHATGVTDCPGEGIAEDVTDAGTAHLGAERIGIDIFGSAMARNTWEAASAAAVGIVPLAQGDYWVAYKALDQTATGCN
jgi:hypothetical protein